MLYSSHSMHSRSSRSRYRNTACSCCARCLASDETIEANPGQLVQCFRNVLLVIPRKGCIIPAASYEAWNGCNLLVPQDLRYAFLSHEVRPFIASQLSSSLASPPSVNPRILCIQKYKNTDGCMYILTAVFSSIPGIKCHVNSFLPFSSGVYVSTDSSVLKI